MSSKRRFVVAGIAGAIAFAVLLGAAFVGGNRPASVQEGSEPPELLSLAEWPMPVAAKRGRVVYEENCIGCHGPEGRGDGEAAEWLEAPPRNFQRGKFKFRSTGSGQLPFEDDLLATVTCGLPGSAMPGFPLLSERQRRDVVAYVLDLAVFNQAKIQLEVELGAGTPRDAILADMPGLRSRAEAASLGARRRIVPPRYPAPTPESIEQGRALYMKSCAACHGREGRGDGSSSYTLRDWQDAAILPRDFTSGTFRSGSTPADIFLRIRTGLNGTPMPSSSESDDTIWSLVHYITSVQSPDRIPLTRRMGCDGGNAR